MGLLFIILGLITPRLTIALLWLFTTWFGGVFETRIWAILGFFFLPITLLWYSVVINWYAGEWNALTIGVLVLAVVLDLSSADKGRKHRS